MKIFHTRSYMWSFLLLLSCCSFGGIKAAANRQNPPKKAENPHKANKPIKEQKATHKHILFDSIAVPDDPRVAIDNDGHAVVIWIEEDEEGLHSIKARISTNSGTSWSDTKTLSAPFCSPINPRVLVQDGKAIVTWFSKDSVEGITFLAAATLTFGDDWLPTVVLSSVDQDVFGNYDVRMNSLNEIVIVWMARASALSAIKIFSANFASGAWSSSQEVS